MVYAWGNLQLKGGVLPLKIHPSRELHDKGKLIFWRRNLMKKLYSVLALAIAASLLLAACGAGAVAKPTDLLSAIKQRGYIVVSTDPNYEPQSFLNTEGKRPDNTKCPKDLLTTAEMQ